MVLHRIVVATLTMYNEMVVQKMKRMHSNLIYVFYHQALHFLSDLSVRFTRSVSLLGIFILLTIVVQCFTGVMIAFSLISEPMLIPISRDTEDMYDLYTDDFFWLHEKGVDLIFFLVIMHFLRKLFLVSFDRRQEVAWKSGSFLFLLLHVVIFFGLVLCCTHLSDITLTIAANIIYTATFKVGKFYWFLFTDQSLNTDTIIRSMYIHYILGLLTIVIGILHSTAMHYDYKDSTYFDGMEKEQLWFDATFRNEIYKYYDMFLIFFLMYLLNNAEPLNYEIFMWGDVGTIVDIRFLGVAPHWYFRAYMGWLLLCPHHYIGVFGLVYFMFTLYFQPNLKMFVLEFFTTLSTFLKKADICAIHKILFATYFLCILYTDSVLPYGRFYNAIGGNDMLLYSYLYIYLYMSTVLYKILNTFLTIFV